MEVLIVLAVLAVLVLFALFQWRPMIVERAEEPGALTEAEAERAAPPPGEAAARRDDGQIRVGDSVVFARTGLRARVMVILDGEPRMARVLMLSGPAKGSVATVGMDELVLRRAIPVLRLG